MTAEQIITLITLIAGLVGAIAALVPTLIKMFNALKELSKNKNWNQLRNIAMNAMQEVEKHYRSNPSMTSKDKLDMAIDLIIAGAKEIGVIVDEKLIEDLVKYIEETIKWANDMKKDS